MIVQAKSILIDLFDALISKGGTQQARRFLLVGLSNTAISYAVFEVALWLLPDLPYRTGVAQILCYPPGIIWSFIWNRHYTFQSNGYWRNEASRFVLLQVFLMLASSVAIALLCDVWGADPRVSWFVILIAVVVTNFFLSKFWIFKS